jgi:hypothetical protein
MTRLLSTKDQLGPGEFYRAGLGKPKTSCCWLQRLSLIVHSIGVMITQIEEKWMLVHRQCSDPLFTCVGGGKSIYLHVTCLALDAAIFILLGCFIELQRRTFIFSLLEIYSM